MVIVCVMCLYVCLYGVFVWCFFLRDVGAWCFVVWCFFVRVVFCMHVSMLCMFFLYGCVRRVFLHGQCAWCSLLSGVLCMLFFLYGGCFGWCFCTTCFFCMVFTFFLFCFFFGGYGAFSYGVICFVWCVLHVFVLFGVFCCMVFVLYGAFVWCVCMVCLHCFCMFDVWVWCFWFCVCFRSGVSVCVVLYGAFCMVFLFVWCVCRVCCMVFVLHVVFVVCFFCVWLFFIWCRLNVAFCMVCLSGIVAWRCVAWCIVVRCCLYDVFCCVFLFVYLLRDACVYFFFFLYGVFV